MDSQLGILLLVLFSSLTLSPETEAGPYTEKYDWLATESAHAKYPMKLVHGSFHLKDGSSVYVPSKAIFHNGWGETGSIHITGSKYKALPTRLTLSWFSFVEDRFYSGDFELPYDKILQLFKNGFASPITGEKSTYEWIVVGMGPEGAVSIWVAGQKLVLEVASYKGGEVDIPWTTVSKSEVLSRADYIEGVLQHRLSADELKELKEKGIPPGISDVYRKQYRWNLSISGQGNPTAWVDTSNGESEYVDPSQTNKSRTSRALPEVINVCWENKRGTKYTADIIFDERETLAAYRKLAALNDDHPMQLQLEITDVPRVIHAWLSDGRYIIKLHNTEVKTFTRR